MVSIQRVAKLALHLWSSQWNIWPNNKQECQRHFVLRGQKLLSLFFPLLFLQLRRTLTAWIHTHSKSNSQATQTFPTLLTFAEIVLHSFGFIVRLDIALFNRWLVTDVQACMGLINQCEWAKTFHQPIWSVCTISKVRPLSRDCHHVENKLYVVHYSWLQRINTSAEMRCV